MEEELGKTKSKFIKAAAPVGPQQWNKSLAGGDLNAEKELKKSKLTNGVEGKGKL
jgi:hypothetical protein